MEQRQELRQVQSGQGYNHRGVRVGIIYVVREGGSQKVLTANNSSRDLLDYIAGRPDAVILYSNTRLSGRQEHVLMYGLDEILDKDYSVPAVKKAVSALIRNIKKAGKSARGKR